MAFNPKDAEHKLKVLKFVRDYFGMAQWFDPPGKLDMGPYAAIAGIKDADFHKRGKEATALRDKITAEVEKLKKG